MDHWTRRDFWGYAAFFGQLRKTPTATAAAIVEDVWEGEVRIPETDEIAQPKFLSGAISPDDKPSTRRIRLSEWMTSKDNRYFSRATVNRIWFIMFGRGIVEPVDDLGQHNPPSHPELLDELAQYFVETDFDLNRLIRTLARTEAYSRTSRTSSTDYQPELFARMQVKSLTAEQLYDCLGEATRQRFSPAQSAAPLGSYYDRNRQNFLMKFRAPTAGLTEYQAGIPQALSLMNGSVIRLATDVARSDILVALNAPFFSDEERVETLFLSTLSRFPTEVERDQFIDYVASGGTTGEAKTALSDVLWALLNSAEFTLNH